MERHQCLYARSIPNNWDYSCIYINKKKFNHKAETTYYIYNYISKFYLSNSFKIEIYHDFDLPVGCGYGASGSGALGAIYGLNKVLRLNLSKFERGRIAHIAEVVNRTGLGTVCGQLAGGLCMLKEPGYPCVFERIGIPKDLIIEKLNLEPKSRSQSLEIKPRNIFIAFLENMYNTIEILKDDQELEQWTNFIENSETLIDIFKKYKRGIKINLRKIEISLKQIKSDEFLGKKIEISQKFIEELAKLQEYIRDEINKIKEI